MNEDAHVVKPATWPPPPVGNLAGAPAMQLQCELCGVWCIVYAAHATGEMQGIKVILPKPAPVEPTEAPVMRGPKIGRPRATAVA